MYTKLLQSTQLLIGCMTRVVTIKYIRGCRSLGATSGWPELWLTKIRDKEQEQRVRRTDMRWIIQISLSSVMTHEA